MRGYGMNANHAVYMYYKTKNSALFCYFDTCLISNIGRVSDSRWHDSLSMYCKTKISASLHYFDTCFVCNIEGASDR